jgi:hypothetical protein
VALGLGLEGRLGREIAVRAAWVDAAGTALAARLPFLRLEDDEMIVALPGPEWTEVLDQHEPLLRGRLKRHPLLAGLRAISGEILPAAARLAAPPTTPAPEPPQEGSASARLERLADILLSRREKGVR